MSEKRRSKGEPLHSNDKPRIVVARGAAATAANKSKRIYESCHDNSFCLALSDIEWEYKMYRFLSLSLSLVSLLSLAVVPKHQPRFKGESVSHKQGFQV